MPYRSRTLHLLLSLLGGLLLALGGFGVPARAQAFPNLNGNHDRFIGQVVAVQGAVSSPDVITLQLGTATVDIRTNPRTMYSARSAEAQVEGLVSGDYALVTARRVRRLWVAMRIQFDVEPFPPLQTFSGTLQRESPDGMRLFLKIDSGRTFMIRLNRNTRFRVDGRPADVPPSLLKGDTLQILALRANARWVAIEVDVRSSVSSFRRLG